MRVLLFLLLPVLLMSQNSKIDSLVTLLELNKKDEKLLISIGESYASQKKMGFSYFFITRN